VGVAQAQTAAAPAPAPAPAPPKPADSSLTWNGITLYGIVDVGLQYQTHGVPISDYFPAGSESIISKNSDHSITGVTPNNLSQSRIGLSGLEPLGSSDVSFVFRLETFFNPHSGNLSDALKSQVLNNGKPLAEQGTTVDSSVAGQLFAGAAYAGFSSASLGRLTFGRHVTPLADGIAKYDPMGAAQAFSVIGFSAQSPAVVTRYRLDQSVKYTGFSFVPSVRCTSSTVPTAVATPPYRLLGGEFPAPPWMPTTPRRRARSRPPRSVPPRSTSSVVCHRLTP
jgi:predicted porin